MRKLKLLLAGLMCVILLPVSLYAQIKTISGQVTDTKSNPLASASVLITHSTQGNSTDAEGKFKINVPENAFIVVSAIGYKSQTFKVSDISGDLSVKLEEDVAKLEEVVVTGLTTTVKRRNLANSVATVNSKQLNGVAPAQTFDGALNGKIPGAYINSNSGAPGGGLSVKLRGVTSIFGKTQPLYVVDGVYMDNSSTSAGLNAVTAAAAGGN